jgi:hypothetical protein
MNNGLGDSTGAVAVVLWRLDPDVSRVTITGPGGVGETRLALHVEHDVVEGFVVAEYEGRCANSDDLPSPPCRRFVVLCPSL